MTDALPNGLRSLHAGTNIRSNLGHRFSNGVVSLESESCYSAPRDLLLGSLGGFFSTPWSEGT